MEMDPITKISTILSPMAIPGSSKVFKSAGFEDVLKSFVQGTAEQMRVADRKTAEFAVGMRHDIHEVVISSEKAGIQFSLLMNIRTKLLEAYQEVMRIQF
jgi:flagellar hook-basal body complex protein FliE